MLLKKKVEYFIVGTLTRDAYAAFEKKPFEGMGIYYSVVQHPGI